MYKRQSRGRGNMPPWALMEFICKGRRGKPPEKDGSALSARIKDGLMF